MREDWKRLTCRVPRPDARNPFAQGIPVKLVSIEGFRVFRPRFLHERPGPSGILRMLEFRSSDLSTGIWQDGHDHPSFAHGLRWMIRVEGSNKTVKGIVGTADAASAWSLPLQRTRGKPGHVSSTILLRVPSGPLQGPEGRKPHLHDTQNGPKHLPCESGFDHAGHCDTDGLKGVTADGILDDSGEALCGMSSVFGYKA